MLSGIQHIRSYIESLWKSYRDGTGEISAVAVSTNAAIMSTQRVEQEFNNKVERPAQYPPDLYPSSWEPIIFSNERRSPNMPLDQDSGRTKPKNPGTPLSLLTDRPMKRSCSTCITASSCNVRLAICHQLGRLDVKHK
jgi:hypothetical protein